MMRQVFVDSDQSHGVTCMVYLLSPVEFPCGMNKRKIGDIFPLIYA
jgi:hypothetical protein